MPLKGEAKRIYQRLYMRRRRLGFTLFASAPDPLLSPPVEMLDPKDKRNVRPDITRRHKVRLDYMLYLNARGYTLVLTSLGYELVDIATGELSPKGNTPTTIYQQVPIIRETAGNSLEKRVAALESRLTLHEAEQVVAERVGNVYLHLEENEAFEYWPSGEGYTWSDEGAQEEEP